MLIEHALRAEGEGLADLRGSLLWPLSVVCAIDSVVRSVSGSLCGLGISQAASFERSQSHRAQLVTHKDHHPTSSSHWTSDSGNKQHCYPRKTFRNTGTRKTYSHSASEAIFCLDRYCQDNGLAFCAIEDWLKHFSRDQFE